jgi:hypothetical protein
MGSLLLWAGFLLLIFGIGAVIAWVAYGLPNEPRPGTKDEAAAKRPT